MYSGYFTVTQLYEVQEKVKLEEKRQEELREQYLKEQELYQTKYACGNYIVSDSIPQSMCLLFSFLPYLAYVYKLFAAHHNIIRTLQEVNGES